MCDYNFLHSVRTSRRASAAAVILAHIFLWHIAIKTRAIENYPNKSTTMYFVCVCLYSISDGEGDIDQVFALDVLA